MVQRSASAAAALYGHLPRATPDTVERRHTANSVADAMYSHLKPPPKPFNPYRAYNESAAQKLA